jgi:hypothetical protein
MMQGQVNKIFSLETFVNRYAFSISVHSDIGVQKYSYYGILWHVVHQSFIYLLPKMLRFQSTYLVCIQDFGAAPNARISIASRMVLLWDRPLKPFLSVARKH